VTRKQDWTDPTLAREWSGDPARGTPTRPEQLDLLLSLVADLHRANHAVLDVGMGSGLVEEALFERLPACRVAGVDGSEAMLALARERLARFDDRYEAVVHDLNAPGPPALPAGPYDVAISVQTIHNVPDGAKRATLAWVHHALAPGGWFLLLDRIAVAEDALFPAYKSLWQRLNRLHGAAVDEGASPREHAERLRASGDQPAALSTHLAWLREAGFAATACLHLHANRALIAARKGG